MALRLKPRSWLEAVGLVTGAVAGVAGTISGVLALTGPADAGTMQRADFQVTRFEPNVTRADFTRRFPADAARAPAGRDPGAVGGVLFLDLGFDGFGDRRCRLTWTMYDDATDAPLDDPAYVDEPAGVFELDDPYVHVTPAVWVPAPTRVEDAYVIFRLRDGERACGSPFQSNLLPVE